MEEKTKRNIKMIEYHKKGMSYRTIGKIFHISQARVFQIIKRELKDAVER